MSITKKIGSRIRREIFSSALSHRKRLIAQNPLDASLHRSLATCLARSGRRLAAHAALRSAALLEAGDGGSSVVNEYVSTEGDLIKMDHNQYYRFLSLSRTLTNLGVGSTSSILDVGGGDGGLAQFLPNIGYFLAEPTVNGISGQSLPNWDHGRFDYVVSCHVLEHVPVEARFGFLDNLMKYAGKGLILSNPFEDERINKTKFLEMFVEVTGDGWAKEHLECTLPRIETMREYAAERGYLIDESPNGYLPFTTAIQLANFFCGRSLKSRHAAAINKLFNSQLQPEMLDMAGIPTAIQVVLLKQ